MTQKYVLRRTSDTDYQFERPNGAVLISATANNVNALPADPNTHPDVPSDIAEPVVTYAENNNALHEWRVVQWVGVRYVDDR